MEEEEPAAKRAKLSDGGIVKSLLRKQKPDKKSVMVSVETFTLVQHQGIEGDNSKNEQSPRQVLLVDADKLADLLTPEQLSANIVVSGTFDGCTLQQLPSGTVLEDAKGSVRLRVTFECEPCATVWSRIDKETQDQVKKESNMKNFEALQPYRGILATVIEGGELALGACLRVSSSSKPPYAALAEGAIQRCLDLVSRIPRGLLAECGEVVTRAGAPSGLARGLPGMLARRRAEDDAPSLFRVVNRDGRLPGTSAEQHKKQVSALEAEGHKVSGAGTKESPFKVERFEDVRWRPTHQELFLQSAQS
mmetsp:Transcript_2340/g.8592  ORF Transcript_2340/g.8592 Transcript_2340/m.8592 type:complete len:306 (+) Transcript_2340:57-974(+)|eukprot:CAMPEP_0170135650 /NCGR_PEP_ID=MMETSP0033_2-20121228/2585_1 /TAXON_ID=195969 /ORGANISM="Dolichomastix tenuilepis, Strain CCMP3274" /LENGTH=305 /DNA_ID=CAMNT_0010371253 /DNA_START=32 /DNA_END=949 /DNA_ORIENTATION=-